MIRACSTPAQLPNKLVCPCWFPVAVAGNMPSFFEFWYAVSMLFLHGYNMDRPSLIDRFRNVITLSSLAYTFTAIHTLQYSMRDHDNDTTTT